jgi:hypothetical protein
MDSKWQLTISGLKDGKVIVEEFNLKSEAIVAICEVKEGCEKNGLNLPKFDLKEILK